MSRTLTTLPNYKPKIKTPKKTREKICVVRRGEHVSKCTEIEPRTMVEWVG